MDHSFYNIFDAFDEAVVICREGRVVYANAAASSLLGSALPGRCEDELFPTPIDSESAFSGSISTSSGAFVVSATPLNCDRLYRISAAQINNSLVNLADSFSASLRAAAQQQRFASDIIRQYTAGIDEPQFVDCMAIHEHSSYRIAKDAENIAFLGSAGNLFDRSSSFNAPSIVKDAVDSLAVFLPNRNIKLLGDSDYIAFIRGDTSAFERILLNLISNAVKYSPTDSPVTVGMSVHNDRFRLSVQDEGDGIDSERLAAVFSAWRLPRPVSDPKAGLGLGLFVVRSLTESFGGTVMIDSKPGRGTRVTVELPISHELSLNEDSLRYSKGDSRFLTDLADVLPSDVYRPQFLD